MKSLTKIDEVEKRLRKRRIRQSVGCRILESFEMKYVVLAFMVALGMLAIAPPTHAAACANGVYRSGCVGPNGAAVVHKAPRTRPHSVSCANGGTRLNGRQVQHTGIDDLIFDIPTVISTGTPEGVGFARKPPLWMKPGDVVEVEIDGGVGVLRNPIIAEA